MTDEVVKNGNRYIGHKGVPQPKWGGRRKLYPYLQGITGRVKKMVAFRVVQARIESGQMRQMLEKYDWTDEEIDHLYEMYYEGIRWSPDAPRPKITNGLMAKRDE